MGNLPPVKAKQGYEVAGKKFEVRTEAVQIFMRNLNVTSKEVKVLDLGCGAGYLSFAIVEAYPHVKVTGIDPCMSLGQAAEDERRKLESSSRSRLAFAIGSPIKLPFKAGTFDLVVGCAPFHFWDDPTQVVKEARRVARHGSRLILQDWAEDILSCRAFAGSKNLSENLSRVCDLALSCRLEIEATEVIPHHGKTSSGALQVRVRKPKRKSKDSDDIAVGSGATRTTAERVHRPTSNSSSGNVVGLRVGADNQPLKASRQRDAAAAGSVGVSTSLRVAIPPSNAGGTAGGLGSGGGGSASGSGGGCHGANRTRRPPPSPQRHTGPPTACSPLDQVPEALGWKMAPLGQRTPPAMGPSPESSSYPWDHPCDTNTDTSGKSQYLTASQKLSCQSDATSSASELTAPSLYSSIASDSDEDPVDDGEQLLGTAARRPLGTSSTETSWAGLGRDGDGIVGGSGGGAWAPYAYAGGVSSTPPSNVAGGLGATSGWSNFQPLAGQQQQQQVGHGAVGAGGGGSQGGGWPQYQYGHRDGGGYGASGVAAGIAAHGVGWQQYQAQLEQSRPQ